VLEHPSCLAALRTAHKLAPADRDFMRRRRVKAGRCGHRVLLARSGCRPSLNPHELQARDEARAQSLVYLQYASPQPWFGGKPCHAVGQLVAVQDGAPTGCASHNVEAADVAAPSIRVGEGLVASQGEAGASAMA